MIDRDELQRLKAAAEAYPFVDENWENSYTRNTGIKWVHYDKKSNFGPSWPLKNNLGFFLREIFTWRKRGWERQLSIKPWWLPRPWRALTWLAYTEPHQPDGSLNDGCIITYWEEAGEFIEHFPPSKVLELIKMAERSLEIPARVSSLSDTEREALKKYDAEQHQHAEEDRS